MANINAKMLKLASKFTSEPDQTRGDNYDCVMLEPSPSGGVIIVATNGHYMIILHDRVGELSRKVSVRVGGVKIEHLASRVNFSEDNKMQQGPVMVCGEVFNWRNPVLSCHKLPENDAFCALNWRYLKNMCKSVERHLGRKPAYPIIIPSHKGAMVVKFEGLVDGFFMLMPVRVDSPMTVPITADEMGILDMDGEDKDQSKSIK